MNELSAKDVIKNCDGSMNRLVNFSNSSSKSIIFSSFYFFMTALF